MHKLSVELPTSNEVEQYKIMRTLWIRLVDKLVKQMPKQAIRECARTLAFEKQGKLIHDHKDEMSLLMDYCIFHYRRNDANVVSRYLAMSPPDNDSIEMSILQSILKSFYSIYVVRAVFSGKGIIAGDILHGIELFIIDIGLSHNAELMMKLSGNIFPYDRFYMTSGVVLPISDFIFKEKIDSIIDKFYKDGSELTPNQEAAFSAQVIRAIIHDGHYNSSEL